MRIRSCKSDVGLIDHIIDHLLKINIVIVKKKSTNFKIQTI